MGFNNKHIKFILLRSKLKAQNLPSIQRESVKCDICNWKAASSKKTTKNIRSKNSRAKTENTHNLCDSHQACPLWHDFF